MGLIRDKCPSGIGKLLMVVHLSYVWCTHAVPMGSSGSVRLRYEKCLQAWGDSSKLMRHVVWAEI